VSLDGLLEQLSGSGLVAFAHAHPGGAAECAVSVNTKKGPKDPVQRGEMTHLSQTTSKAGFNRRAASRRDLAAGMLLRPSSNRATLLRRTERRRERKKWEPMSSRKRRRRRRRGGGRQSVREREERVGRDDLQHGTLDGSSLRRVQTGQRRLQQQAVPCVGLRRTRTQAIEG
jgi:hypothetical protein